MKVARAVYKKRKKKKCRVNFYFCTSARIGSVIVANLVNIQSTPCSVYINRGLAFNA